MSGIMMDLTHEAAAESALAFLLKDGNLRFFFALSQDKQCVLDSGDEQIEEQGGEEGSTINEGKGFPSFEVRPGTEAN
jgi:hypothetical protein